MIKAKKRSSPAKIPYTYDLFHQVQDNGWPNIRRGVASIRESQMPRRAISA
jgi:hypothetical protein